MRAPKKIRALVRGVGQRLAGVSQSINMHAFGFSLALASALVVSDVKRFPTGDGRLDRALKLAIERGAFEPWKDWLAFADTRVGLRCVQLQEALLTAQMTGIIWFPEFNYNEAEVLISADAARTMLRNNKLPEETARSWGATLVAALAEV